MNSLIAGRGRMARGGKGRAVAVLTLLLALFSLASCSAPVSLLKEKPSADLQWPQKPFEAKIRWMKTIADARDVGITKSFWKKALEFFIGAEQRRIVKPYGVLFDSAERLFIADPGAGLVHFMEMKEGRYILIGDESNSPLRTPIGLAEDEHDRLYITDSTTGNVYLYDLAGRSLKPFLGRTLQRPTGIAYNRVNKLLYVVDTAAGRVVAVDESGAEKLRFGSSGAEKGEFNHPTDITVDAKGFIYVTDPLNYKIKVFTPEGKLVNQFGAPGDAPGNLNKPKGVAVDSEGHIYVSDALFDSVQIFDTAGRLLLSFGWRGTENGTFWMPSGIFIDQHDYIFVADTYNQRVQVFRYLPEGGAIPEAKQQGKATK